MMALSTPIAAFAEDADGQNSSETTPEESTTTVTTQKSAAEQKGMNSHSKCRLQT